ncbi:unnamed protein product, partial [marine sediment metagenome]
AAGVLNGILVAKVGIPSIVATIAMMFFWRGVVHVISQGLPIVLGAVGDTALFQILTGRVGGVIPTQFLWMLLLVVV